jgi:two-component system, cell cycle response regulator
VKRLQEVRFVALALAALLVPLLLTMALLEPGKLVVAALLVGVGAAAFVAGLRLGRSSVAPTYDRLTGLRNRSRLLADLDETDLPTVLLLFDLDGFKRYNDAFGYAAGDALLARLGGQLAASVGGRARAYRLDGDEFGVLAPAFSDVESLAADATAALSEQGEGFTVSCSYATAELPLEAGDSAEALKLADRRLYAVKQSSSRSPGRQSSDVLLQALSERYPSASAQFYSVAEVASAVAEQLAVSGDAIVHIRLAAELHDVGKIAIPDAILQKPGELDESEWEFVRQHPLVGERIISAAPALREAARLVRSSHERWDGTGYPDGLAGDKIPLGSRIIAICDAFNAMMGARPYRRGISEEMALEQLRRCAGSQFDPELVRVFFAVHAERRVGEPLPLSA